jgi:cobalamin biosynthesis protein CobD/CbiB
MGSASTVKTIVALIGLGILLYIFRPTAVVLIFGLFPTAIAFLMDRTPERHGVISVGAMNMAGVLPILVLLWTQDHSVAHAVKQLSDPLNGAVIVLTSLIGLTIYLAAPSLAMFVLRFRLTRREREVEQRQRDLEMAWGRDVASAEAAEAVKTALAASQPLGAGVERRVKDTPAPSS